MKKAFRILGIALAAIVALALVAYAVAWGIAKHRYGRVWSVHEAGFPIPFPLGDADLEAIRAGRIAGGASPEDPLAGVDLGALALARAQERGKHLIDSRVGCTGCHGKDFGGAPVIDMLLVGRWVAPNLTTGKGGVARGYTASDWDHAVRHGLRRGGLTSSMPSNEFATLSDHELSDIVAYIRSVPPVDRDPGRLRFGPVLSALVATDSSMFAATVIDHQKKHAVEPPATAPTAEFGEHLVQVCRGCHGPNLSGGKIGGDPNMPIVANLTPHETGLKAWSEADFIRALRDGKRPDGTAIKEAMPWKAYGQMSDAELKAIYAYLRTVPPVPKGDR